MKENTSPTYLVDEAVRLIKSLADSKEHMERVNRSYTLLICAAARFTPEPITIEITAEYQVGDVHIHVSDTGIGIPESELDNIIIPFYELEGLMRHTCRHLRAWSIYHERHRLGAWQHNPGRGWGRRRNSSPHRAAGV